MILNTTVLLHLDAYVNDIQEDCDRFKERNGSSNIYDDKQLKLLQKHESALKLQEPNANLMPMLRNNSTSRRARSECIILSANTLKSSGGRPELNPNWRMKRLNTYNF